MDSRGCKSLDEFSSEDEEESEGSDIAELVHVSEPSDVYIGRGDEEKDLLSAEPGEYGWLGNPFKLKKHGGEYTREESLEKYREALEKRLDESEEFRQKFLDLKGKRLGRYCSPDEKCHGDVILEKLRELHSKDTNSVIFEEDDSEVEGDIFL